MRVDVDFMNPYCFGGLNLWISSHFRWLSFSILSKTLQRVELMLIGLKPCIEGPMMFQKWAYQQLFPNVCNLVPSVTPKKKRSKSSLASVTNHLLTDPNVIPLLQGCLGCKIFHPAHCLAFVYESPGMEPDKFSRSENLPADQWNQQKVGAELTG